MRHASARLAPTPACRRLVGPMLATLCAIGAFAGVQAQTDRPAMTSGVPSADGSAPPSPRVAAPVGSPERPSTPGRADASPAAVIEPGDPRSEGEGPGLVGDPLTVLAGVVLVGIATVAATALFARLTRRS